MSLQLASTMRTAFLCDSVTVDCWKDYALYVVEVDASSQGIDTLQEENAATWYVWRNDETNKLCKILDD